MEETAFPTTFGEWHKNRRKILDLTQAELADRAGCSVPAVRKIEAGERRPSKQLAGLLAESLDISPEDQTLFIKVARGELNIERLYSYVSSRASIPIIVPESSTRENNLPVHPTPLIGREAELNTLEKLLADPHCRLLTLIGLGGIGKTRLAIELAFTQQGMFPGGVFYISFVSLNSPEFIVPVIAKVFGLSFSGSLEPKAQLLNYLSIHIVQKTLLVLDNLEHLLIQSSQGNTKDNVALLLAELLHRTPRLKILATSIERINIQGEWTFELHGLPFPTVEGSNRLENFDAAALFIKRARQVKVDFRVLPEERPFLVRVCQLVEGVPLAIELAAAWVGMLSIAEIAQEIESNVDFLTTTMRDIPERHRSLRAVFENSFRLLLEEECAVLCRLSLFRGGFSREAAEQVAGASLASLTALVNKSFLFRSGVGRYELHDILRQFALEKLKNAGGFEETSDKFLDYMVSLTREAEEQLRGPQQGEWIDLLDHEMDNIRAVLEWAISPDASVVQVEKGLQLVIACIRFLQGRGYVREGISWLERGLSVNKSISPAIRAKALGYAGWMVTYLNDCQRARSLLRESITMYRQIDNKPGLAKALDNLGDIAWYIGDFAESKASYEESLALLRKLGDPGSIGLSLYSIGRLHVDNGFYPEAESYLKEGLSLLQSIPDWRGIAMCTNGLGRLALFQGDVAAARERFCQALRLNHELGHKLSIAECFRELAVIALSMDQEVRAIRLWSAATRLQESLDVTFPNNDPIYRYVPQIWFDQIVSSPDWKIGHTMPLDQAIECAKCVESLEKG